MKPKNATVAVALLVGGLISIAGWAQSVQSPSLGMAEIEDYGTVLVNGAGLTLYRFADDAPGQSRCTAGCEEAWPIVQADLSGIEEGLDPTRFSVIERDDGRFQTTFLGWPLYTYTGDSVPGETLGESVNNAWFVVRPEEMRPLVAAWMNEELIDVVSGASFRVSDFYGRPVLIESFAVWCSTCLRQQREMAKLVESEGESVIHISLDTDPNEDIASVRAHAAKHGFEWLFAVSPVELTRTLIDEFGLAVVNAPRAPVILVAPDGAARLLRNGVKTADSLMEEIEGGMG